jgi:hypothetical protein
MSKLTALLKNTGHNLWGDFRKFWWIPLGLLLYYFIMNTFFTASCPIYQVIGLPCTGCGMSRALRYVITGQFIRAFQLNPLAFVIILFAFYCFYHRYIKGNVIPRFVSGVVIIFILMFGYYIVRMYLHFPDQIPYVYNYNNAFEDIIPGYRNFMRGLLKF